jgi:ketosteroid isomerase-like protein
MTDTADSDRAQVERVLDALYGARIGGELGRLAGLFAPNAQFRISGSSDGKPIAISVRDEAPIRGWLTVLLKSFTLSGYTVLARIVDGNRAAVHWRAVIHSRITGASIATELVDLVEVRGERIASYVEFFAPV